MTRVIAAYSDHVVMEPSLDAALSRIFGGQVSTSALTAPGAPPGGTAVAQPPAAAATDLELIRQANQHFERAQQLLREGNWTGYGEEIKKVGEVLKRLEAPPRPGK